MRLSAILTVLAAVALPALADYKPPYGGKPPYGKPTPTLPCSTPSPTPTCAAAGQPCQLDNPGACCSKACERAEPQPTCIAL
ncbi:hypothetical protein RSOL_521770, partial [Rhizoctonia solani AG-3 Rhs1AP]